MRKLLLFFLFLYFFIPVVYAKSNSEYIVMEYDSGRILSSYDMHNPKLIASTTKIMTCIITLENISLDKKIIVGDEILNIYGTNIYVKPGEELTVEDLLYGLMLRSGNDAAIVLAENVFSSQEEFILKMNEKAKEIGMIDTTFENPHGLDDDSSNFSTAYDMALLARYAYRNLDYRKIISTKKYVTKSNFKSYVWYNRMSLLTKYANCIGGKNGYTPKAGKTLVSYAKKEDMILIIVSLDDDDIYNNHEKIYNKFFKQYSNYNIINKDKFTFSTSLYNSKDLYVKESFTYPLKDDEVNSVSTLIKLFPKSQNNKVGILSIYLDKELLYEINIYEKDIKKEEGFNLFNWLKKLFIR